MGYIKNLWIKDSKLRSRKHRKPMECTMKRNKLMDIHRSSRKTKMATLYLLTNSLTSVWNNTLKQLLTSTKF